ncbi:hypothetical protein QTV44_002531 [Vibrio vulnificus]|nr:hypothetical protein [Vibrio vulnificus]
MGMRTDLLTLHEREPAAFAHDTLVNLNDYLEHYGIYLLPKSTSHQGAVPLDSIVGHSQGYGSFTWEQGLHGHGFKRMPDALSKAVSNPSYYLSPATKVGMSFIKIGDDYFIEGGKHRTITARFLAHYNPDSFSGSCVLSGVEITERFVDYEFMHLASTIRDIQASDTGLYISLRYAHESSRVCLTLRRKGIDNCILTRAQALDFISDYANPSVKGKLMGRAHYPWISYTHCVNCWLSSEKS